MNNYSKLRIILGLCLFYSIDTICQNTVHLTVVDEGRGILRSRGNECFVIAPNHLINDAQAINVDISGENRKKSLGKLEKSFPGDIALIRIESGAYQNCSSWNVIKDYTSVLNNVFEGYLEIRNEDGSVDQELMLLKNKTYEGITIQAKDKSFEFSKGLSGSSLFSDISGVKIYLGMLLTVDENNTKSGNVFQADDMDRIMKEFFDTNFFYRILNYNCEPDVVKSIEIEDHDVSIEFSRAITTETEISIFFNLYNRISLKKIKINPKIIKVQGTKLYDSAGNFANATEIKVFENNISNYKGPNGIRYYRDEVNIIINFKGKVNSDCIALLELNVNSNNKILQFRNLKIVNDSDIDLDFEGDGLYYPYKSNMQVGNADEDQIISYSYIQSEEIEGVQFDLIGALKFGNRIILKFKIRSINSDKKLLLNKEGTKYYDKSGWEKNATELNLAGIRDINYSCGKDFIFVANVPVAFDVIIEDIPEPTGISLIEVSILIDRPHVLKFRNISFE